MESLRQQKYGRLVQKELSEIIQREMAHVFGKAFLTVTVVRMSPDLGVAKVYLSLLMQEDKERFLKTLDHVKKEIRMHLGRRIGKQVRRVPELIFYMDDTAEYTSKMDRLIDELHIPPARDDENE